MTFLEAGQRHQLIKKSCTPACSRQQHCKTICTSDNQTKPQHERQEGWGGHLFFQRGPSGLATAVRVYTCLFAGCSGSHHVCEQGAQLHLLCCCASGGEGPHLSGPEGHGLSHQQGSGRRCVAGSGVWQCYVAGAWHVTSIERISLLRPPSVVCQTSTRPQTSPPSPLASCNPPLPPPFANHTASI